LWQKTRKKREKKKEIENIEKYIKYTYLSLQLKEVDKDAKMDSLKVIDRFCFPTKVETRI
jgi:hypothetical protein